MQTKTAVQVFSSLLSKVTVPSSFESKAAKISAFNNGPPGTDEANSKKYQGGGANVGGLVVSGIPMSQRTGAPIPNLTSVNAQYRKIPQTVAEEQPGDRISRTKTAKENKAIK